MFKNFPELEFDDDDLTAELEKYKQYIKNTLLIKHISVDDAFPELSEQELSKYNNLISIQNEISTTLDNKDLMSFIIEYGKLLNGYFEDNISSGGDPWMMKNSEVQKNIVIMQSVMDLIKGSYHSAETPHCLKFEASMPSVTNTITDQTEFTRIKSLIELLDRHDLDYTVLKTLVEDNYYSIFSENSDPTILLDPQNQYKIVSSNEYPWGSTSRAWKPMIVPDEVKTFPTLKFTDQNIRSLSFWGQRAAPPTDLDDASRNPYLNSFSSKAEANTNFLEEEVYPSESFNSSHIFLDIPGHEDPDQPFIKRIPDAAVTSMLSLLGPDSEQYTEPETIKELTSLKQDGGQTRTFSQILEGEKASSEILYFQINKYLEHSSPGGQAGQHLLQTFWMPNAPEFNPKHFIDSQITSNDDKTFIYKIFAWTAIYGNKYYYKLSGVNAFVTYEQDKPDNLPSLSDFFENNYRNLDIETGAEIFDMLTFISHQIDGNFPLITKSEIQDSGASSDSIYNINFHTETYPDIKLIKVPFHPVGGVVDSTQVFRPPPSPPAVEIVPYEGVDNSLLFLLNARVGATHKDFIVGIEDKDNTQIQTIYEALISSAKGWNANDLEQEFITQDVKRFEIFRLDKKPSSYSDFAPENGGKKIELIPPTTKGTYEGFGGTNFSFDNGPQDLSIVASTAQFRSAVVPNKKYYYTFRVIDQEDYFSNPTPVYQVEIINDGGTIYPLIDIVDFDIENNLQTKKTVRKYIHIIPTLEHSMLNFSHNLGHADFENDTAGSYINKLTGKKPILGIVPNSNLIIPEEHYAEEGKKNYLKLRLTSKKTGKKIDINFRPVHKHNKTTQEEEGFQKGETTPSPDDSSGEGDAWAGSSYGETTPSPDDSSGEGDAWAGSSYYDDNAG
jgi:hypothetical protein